MTSPAKLNVRLAVRDFAMPCPARGHIESQSASARIAQAGQEMHSRYLNSRKKKIEGYEIEVKSDRRFELRGQSGEPEPEIEAEIQVKGRIDGVRPAGGGAQSNASGGEPAGAVCLEEIKSDFDIRGLKRRLTEEPDHPYILQILTYGYIWFKEKGEVPELELHLVSSKDGDVIVYPVRLDLEWYERWLSRRLKAVVSEYRMLARQRERRRRIAETMKFPLPELRPGQQDLIDCVEEVVQSAGRAMIQAPTGLGKTLGVLYPTLKEALGRGDQVVYVTPKNSQHRVAEDAAEKLRRDNPDLRSLTLTAKAKLCLKEEVFCNPDYCQYARDYYSKVEENNLIDRACSTAGLDGDKFIELGKKYKVCPFELSLDTISRADVVIGDYNYVFSPRNIMGRFQPRLGIKAEAPDLIVDEAHNLPDRVAGYYSAELSLAGLGEMAKAIEALPPAFSLPFRGLLEELMELVRSHRPATRKDQPVTVDAGRFEKLAEKISGAVSDYLSGSLLIGRGDPALGLLFEVQRFVEALTQKGGESVTLWKVREGGILKVLCLDAAARLKESYQGVRSVVAFSATLKPFDCFARLLGFDGGDLKSKELPSPFPARNRKLMVIPQVSTKYADREKNYSKIAEAVCRIVAQRPGNYLVFFPSFEFLSRVAALAREELERNAAELLLQEREMRSTAIDQYLDRLRAPGKPAVFFAVQGGVFAEGVDYPGDMLIGVIIVGPGLPVFDIERNLLADFYERHYGNGFEYAYVYPGMSRVVQSAGRVIRSEKDRGLIVLLDRRFVEPSYGKAMPDYWFDTSANELVSNSILKDINEFWSLA